MVSVTPSFGAVIQFNVPGRRGTGYNLLVGDKQTHGVAFADEEKSQGIQQDEEFDDLYGLLDDVG